MDPKLPPSPGQHSFGGQRACVDGSCIASDSLGVDGFSGPIISGLRTVVGMEMALTILTVRRVIGRSELLHFPGPLNCIQ